MVAMPWREAAQIPDKSLPTVAKLSEGALKNTFFCSTSHQSSQLLVSDIVRYHD